MTVYRHVQTTVVARSPPLLLQQTTNSISFEQQWAIALYQYQDRVLRFLHQHKH